MKQLLDKLFPTLSDELIIVITLIICLLVTASIALFLVKSCRRKPISANWLPVPAHGGLWRQCLSVPFSSATTFLIFFLHFSLL